MNSRFFDFLNFRSRAARAVVLCAAIAGAALLSGCAYLFGGAAALGLSSTDRRTVGAQLDDARIEGVGQQRLRENLGERARIDVTSYNRLVLLTGEAQTEQDRQLIEQIMARVENVRIINNEVAVMDLATLQQRSTDTLIASRVKANLIDAKDLISSAYKITVSRGVVYLLGRVTAREADRATDVVRRTPGVVKVVRLFELISEEEYHELQPRPVEAPAQGRPPGGDPTTKPQPAPAPRPGAMQPSNLSRASNA